MNKHKLDIGCGKSKHSGYIGMDKIKLPGVDIVHDLEKFPYPFKKNMFDEVICSHILEHVEDVIKTMEEIYRILKPGGILKIWYPYCKASLAYCDPTHKHYFSENAFDLFDYRDMHNYYTKSKFKIIKKEFYNNKAGRFLQFMPYFLRKFLRYFLWDMFDGVYIELKVIKTPVKH